MRRGKNLRVAERRAERLPPKHDGQIARVIELAPSPRALHKNCTFITSAVAVSFDAVALRRAMLNRVLAVNQGVMSLASSSGISRLALGRSGTAVGGPRRCNVKMSMRRAR
jgi:hypothetical protein